MAGPQLQAENKLQPIDPPKLEGIKFPKHGNEGVQNIPTEVDGKFPDDISLVGGFSLKGLVCGELPALNPKEQHAIGIVQKHLPKVVGEDGLLNSNDIPALVNALLKDPKVISEINSGINAEINRKTQAIHDRPVIGAVENLPLLGRPVEATINTFVDSYVESNMGKYSQQGVAVAKQRIAGQLSQLFKVHGTVPTSNKADMSPRAEVSKEVIEELGSALKVLGAYQQKTMQAYAMLGQTKTFTSYANGISPKLFVGLDKETPTLVKLSKEEKEKLGAMTVGYVPLESSLRYATNEDLCRFGFTNPTEFRKTHVLYYDGAESGGNRAIVSRDKSLSADDPNAWKVTYGRCQWYELSNSPKDMMRYADAQLLDLRQVEVSSIKSELAKPVSPEGIKPGSLEDIQRNADIQTLGRFHTWVNSIATKIDMSEPKNLERYGLNNDEGNKNFDFYVFGNRDTDCEKVVAISKLDSNCVFMLRNGGFQPVPTVGEHGAFQQAFTPAEIGLIQKLQAD